MNFPASYGAANQQYFSNSHTMNTLLTAQQLQQLQLHSQKQQQQHQFQQRQLHQFQQQQMQHQQEQQQSQTADMKLRNSMQSPMEKDRAPDSSSKD